MDTGEVNTTKNLSIAPVLSKKAQRMKEYRNAHPELAAIGGRAKKGKRHASTIEREKVLELAKDIIAGRTLKLIDAQTLAAFGTIRVFRVDYEYFGKKKVAKRPELVTNTSEMADAIHWHYHEGPDPNDETHYYFVEEVRPDNRAIDSLLDRSFGKATETKKITLDVEVDEETEEMAFGAVMGFIGVKKSKSKHGNETN